MEGEGVMTATLTSTEVITPRGAWLADHPVVGSVVVAVLAGAALQLTM
jgi:hypothetical protein